MMKQVLGGVGVTGGLFFVTQAYYAYEEISVGKRIETFISFENAAACREVCDLKCGIKQNQSQTSAQESKCLDNCVLKFSRFMVETSQRFENKSKQSSSQFGDGF